jgi:hypothetical protein
MTTAATDVAWSEAVRLLTTGVLRRMGRAHRLNHPLYAGERQFDVAMGDQTSVSADVAPHRGAWETTA